MMNLKKIVLVSGLVVSGIAVSSVFSSANADVITSNTSAEGTTAGYIGQSVTTGNGGPWNNITFNFFSNTAATNPSASGNLFIFSQAYSGIVGNLSSGATGYLADTTTISGGKYIFQSNLTLQPQTQYFFYSNALFFPTVAISFSNPYPGGNAYRDIGGSSGTFGSNPLFDYAFQLNGTILAVPEPLNILGATAGLVLFGTVSTALKRRKVSKL